MSDHLAAGPTIYYQQVELDNPTDPSRIDLVRAPNAPTPPEAMRLLTKKIQQVAAVVEDVFVHHPKLRKDFFYQLHVTADTGLRGPGYNVEQGLDNLIEVEGHVVQAFPKVRDYYWNRYALAVLFAILPFLLGAAAYYIAHEGIWGIPKPDKGEYNIIGAIGIAIFWIPVGVAIGIFLEFIYSVNRTVQFDQLININPGRWRPFQRFVNTILGAYVFAGLMGLSLFEIGVMSVLLNEFLTTRPPLSLLVGFVTGFSSPYVQDIISQVRPAIKTGSGN
jgi:hypothetical protein